MHDHVLYPGQLLGTNIMRSYWHILTDERGDQVIMIYEKASRQCYLRWRTAQSSMLLPSYPRRCLPLSIWLLALPHVPQTGAGFHLIQDLTFDYDMK